MEPKVKESIDLQETWLDKAVVVDTTDATEEFNAKNHD